MFLKGLRRPAPPCTKKTLRMNWKLKVPKFIVRQRSPGFTRKQPRLFISDIYFIFEVSCSVIVTALKSTHAQYTWRPKRRKKSINLIENFGKKWLTTKLKLGLSSLLQNKNPKIRAYQKHHKCTLIMTLNWLSNW